MHPKLSREVSAAGLVADGRAGPVVTEADLAGLPRPAQRYLTFMGVVGRPRDTSFRAQFRGRFRLGASHPWREVDALQYSSRPDVARIFHLRMRIAGLSVYGRDTYVHGHGRMWVRPLDLFTVQDARGPEYDIGELVTFLNDAVLLAPSMLLGPGIAWSPVDDRAFDLAFTNEGTTVKARVFVDERGAPVDFETTDRFASVDPLDPARKLVRARWTTPVEGYRAMDGRMLPTSGRAVWHLPKGDFPYIEFGFEPGDIAFNVAPGL